MTVSTVLHHPEYCDCGDLAMVQIDWWWRDHGEIVWDSAFACHPCAPARELAVYTLDTESVVVLPVQYVICGVVWPPAVGLLSHLTGEGNAA